MSVSSEFAVKLQAAGLSLNFNGVGAINCFVGILPDSPDQCVAIFERPGQAPILTMTGQSQAESLLDQPAVQIRVRTAPADYVAGNTLMQGVYKVFQGFVESALNVGGLYFHLITALGSPLYLGQDVRQRHEWSQTFRTIYDDTQRQ